jgi:hypothetical protein
MEMNLYQMMKKVFSAFVFLSVFYFSAFAISPNLHVVHVLDYNLASGTKENATPIIQKILEDYKTADTLHILFGKGRYDFYDYKGVARGPRDAAIAINLKNRKNLVIDGKNADFVFHGKMIVCDIFESENITLRNFTVDWDRPYNSQASVIDVTPDYIDFEIDRNEYPYEVVNDTIFFLGEGWRSPITPVYGNLFESETKNIIYQTRDLPLGEELFQAKVSEIGANKVRFHYKTKFKPAIGAIIVFFHGRYIANGIDVRSSKDVVIENTTIYHTLSCGVHGFKSENISLKNVHIINNELKNRAFSTVADATHFNGCKGQILFDNCSVGGAGDDFMNIHGMYAKVTKVIDSHTVLINFEGRYIGFEKDEDAWVIDTNTMQRGNIFKVAKHEAIYAPNGTSEGYKVTFYHSVLGEIKVGDLLENKDRNPSLIVRNSKMMKQNRGRSILCSTFGDVLIENNYFNSAGAAIMIDGDMKLWYESGGVNNVVIRNNIFENCYTSGNNIIDEPWGWGEGVISITPSVVPKGLNFPTYHKNILIENNTFKHYDYQLLYARSVNHLTFRNNKLIRTYDYNSFYRKTNFYLDGCKNVIIEGNTFDKNFLGRDITIENMKKSDIIRNRNPKLNIAFEKQ